MRLRAALLLAAAAASAAVAATVTVTTTTTAADVRILLTDWITQLGQPDTAIDPSYLLVSTNFFLAVDAFNRRDTTVLPDLAKLASCQKNLSIVKFCDESASARRAALMMSELAAQANAVVGFASYPAPVEGTTLAETIARIPVVSHWTSAAELRFANRYPMFSRVQIGDDVYVEKLATFIQSLRVSSFGILYVNSDSSPLLKLSL